MIRFRHSLFQYQKQIVPTCMFYSVRYKTEGYNKTYGVLHANVKQLLRIVHPDSFRFPRESEEDIKKYEKMSMDNQRSLQNLNSFNNVMRNYKSNMNTFLQDNTETLPIQFHVFNPTKKTNNIKTIRTSLVYPNSNKHVWVRHKNPMTHMFHWRDVHMLDLLHRVNTEIGADLDISLMPNTHELEVLQRVSKQTRIPMPIHFQEPKVKQFNKEEEGGEYDIPFEEQNVHKMQEQLEKSKLLWEELDGDDFYSALRQETLSESSHPRNPNFHMNKKFGIQFTEPAKDQLKKMLKCMQIDFPVGTDPAIMKSMYQFLINNAKELKIWEWYHTPMIIGTEKFTIVDNCILGIPFNCRVGDVNNYLEKNLPVLRNNGEVFREQLKVIGEKMLELKDTLNLVDIQTDLFVTRDKIEACLDHLLDRVKYIDKYNLSLLKVRIHNKKDLCFFSETSGTVNLPYDVTDEQLNMFLDESKSKQLFANYRIAKRSIPHLKHILLDKMKIQSLEIPEKFADNILAHQAVFAKILKYVAEFAPYNTLEKVSIVVRHGIKMKYKNGVLYLPSTFEAKEIHSYFTKLVTETKQRIDSRLPEPSQSTLKFTHLKPDALDNTVLETKQIEKSKPISEKQ